MEISTTILLLIIIIGGTAVCHYVGDLKRVNRSLIRENCLLTDSLIKFTSKTKSPCPSKPNPPPPPPTRKVSGGGF